MVVCRRWKKKRNPSLRRTVRLLPFAVEAIFYAQEHINVYACQCTQMGANMKNTVEIRWHGRGGQGAKTAALLLADVAFKAGKFVQGFPEYGPERMGAPITAYNRISAEPVTVHSNIYDPDYVVVVDDGLLESTDVTHGLKENGAVIINTEKEKDELLPLLHDYKGAVYTLNAKAISMQALGKNYPNSPMLAAVVAVSGVMGQEEFLKEMLDSFQHKFAKKPEVISGNMKALELTFAELQSQRKAGQIHDQ